MALNYYEHQILRLLFKFHFGAESTFYTRRSIFRMNSYNTTDEWGEEEEAISVFC